MRRLLLLALLLMTVPLLTWAIDPETPSPQVTPSEITTREQADLWLHTIPYNVLLDWIILKSHDEWSSAQITSWPLWGAVITDNDVTAMPVGPIEVTRGSQKMDIHPPNLHFKDLVKPNSSDWLIPAGIGVGVGIVVTVIVASLVK